MNQTAVVDNFSSFRVFRSFGCHQFKKKQSTNKCSDNIEEFQGLLPCARSHFPC